LKIIAKSLVEQNIILNLGTDIFEFIIEVHDESTKPQDKVISCDYNAICVHTLIAKVKNAEATFSILLSLEKF
jgi:hypothetical protein